MMEMADSTTPRLIGGGIRTAAAYINGHYSWSRAEEQEFGRLIRISVMPGQPEAARYARALDVERYDATPADVAPFIAERSRLGHQDATIYCSAAAIGHVIEACTAAKIVVPRWWLAWWWERPGYPDRAEVAAEVKRLSGADISPETIWACQYVHGEYWDTSIIYGKQDFSR